MSLSQSPQVDTAMPTVCNTFDRVSVLDLILLGPNSLVILTAESPDLKFVLYRTFPVHI